MPDISHANAVGHSMQPAERLDLLARLLRFDNDVHDIGGLRVELLNDMSSLEAVMQAAARRQLLPAAIDQLRVKGILPPRQSRRAAKDSLLAQLTDLDAQFKIRRSALGGALHDIVGCLNKADIQPIVLKGSMSLISGEPEWRFQRDIDFAVDPSEAGRTVTALRAEGFRECDEMDRRPHHLKPMQRNDVPGIIEPHVKLAGTRARAVLPDDVLMGTVGHHAWKGLSYRAMSKAGFLLHGLAHHHFQNRGYIYGTVSLKGLLEFAHCISGMQETDVLELDALSGGHPRLKAGLLLWCALAKRLLGVTLPQGLITSNIVENHAETVSIRYLRGQTVSPFAGVREHIVLTLLHAPKTSLASSVVPSILDGCHIAVWWSHETQRRNASGILTND